LIWENVIGVEGDRRTDRIGNRYGSSTGSITVSCLSIIRPIITDLISEVCIHPWDKSISTINSLFSISIRSTWLIFVIYNTIPTTSDIKVVTDIEWCGKWSDIASSTSVVYLRAIKKLSIINTINI